jgi:hypothetical protein
MNVFGDTIDKCHDYVYKSTKAKPYFNSSRHLQLIRLSYSCSTTYSLYSKTAHPQPVAGPFPISDLAAKRNSHPSKHACLLGFSVHHHLPSVSSLGPISGLNPSFPCRCTWAAVAHGVQTCQSWSNTAGVTQIKTCEFTNLQVFVDAVLRTFPP